MSLTFFKPNKNNAGTLLNINYVARPEKENDKGDKSFYVKLVRQVSWNESEQIGSFSGGASVIAKLSLNEVAGILDAINRNTSLAVSMGVKYVYHDGKETASTIDFSPAFKKVKDGDKWVSTEEQRGFSFRVTKTDKKDKAKSESFSIGFSYAETELLALFIKDGLGHCFNALRSEEIDRLRKYKEDRSEGGERNDNRTEAPKQVLSKKVVVKRESVKAPAAPEPESPREGEVEVEEEWS